MIILFLLVVALVIGIIIECVNIFEHGTPAKDSDILEMLENCETVYEVEKKWNDKFKLKTPSFRSSAPNISQTQYSVVFPYYISGVGVVPIWYKSAGKIKTIFEEKLSTSRYEVTKRDKLGLNKK